MPEGDDNKDDIELQNEPSSDKDKRSEDKIATDSVGESTDKPPTPPKRDYSSETSAPMSKDSDSPTKKHSRFFPRPEVIYSPEKSKSSMTCLKNCLVIFNLLIWLFGAVLTALGLWVKFDSEFQEIQSGVKVSQFTTAALVLIVAGVIIMIVGFVGCCGALMQITWLLVVFCVIIVIVIIMEIAVMAVVWSAVANKSMHEKIKAEAKSALQKMGENESFQRLVDLMQSKLHCCGVDGPDDYSYNKEQPNPMPRSCTNFDTALPYEKGCATAIVDYFKGKAAVLGGIALAVFILQLGVLVFTVCVICGIKHAATNSIF